MTLTLHSVTFDAHRPLAIARFWAAAMGWPEPVYGEKELEWLHGIGVEAPEDDPVVGIRDPEKKAPQLLFLKVPESKEVKNRVHLDVRATTTMHEEVDRLVGLGASVVGEATDWGQQTWTVMRDPEGNEFCVERSKAERQEPETS